MQNIYRIPIVDAQERACRRSLQALEDEHVEERAIVKVYILDPTTIAI